MQGKEGREEGGDGGHVRAIVSRLLRPLSMWDWPRTRQNRGCHLDDRVEQPRVHCQIAHKSLLLHVHGSA
jgi:hypothetical protein